MPICDSWALRASWVCRPHGRPLSRSRSPRLLLARARCGVDGGVRSVRRGHDQSAREGRCRRCVVPVYGVRVYHGGRDGVRWLLLPRDLRGQLGLLVPELLALLGGQTSDSLCDFGVTLDFFSCQDS